MTRVSISEAARLTGKSRTTLHRLIKTGELSTCSGERNAKMVDISELLRVFGPFDQPKSEHLTRQVPEQCDTAPADQSEHIIRQLKQQIGVSLEIGNFCTLSALFNQSWFVRG